MYHAAQFIESDIYPFLINTRPKWDEGVNFSAVICELILIGLFLTKMIIFLGRRAIMRLVIAVLATLKFL